MGAKSLGMLLSPSIGSLFSIEIDSGSDAASEANKARLQAQLALLQRHVITCLRPTSMFHQRLIRDVRLMKQDVYHEEDGIVDAVVLATKLSSVGYRVHLRSALGAAATEGIQCYYNLKNEFLIVSGDGVAEGQEFIVEARFRDHFAIPQPTPRYEGLLQAVPAEVVATPETLTALVQLLCSEMSLAFEEQGLALPPWRHAKSLLSKWLPARARDYDVCSPAGGCSPRGGATPKGIVLSTLSSGLMTPLGTDGDDSPRAVLRSAAAALSPFNGVPQLPRACESDSSAVSSVRSSGNATLDLKKRKSLLSETLAAIKPVKTAASARCSSVEPDGDYSPTSVGWLTPIRRVRMQGSSA